MPGCTYNLIAVWLGRIVFCLTSNPHDINQNTIIVITALYIKNDQNQYSLNKHLITIVYFAY